MFLLKIVIMMSDFEFQVSFEIDPDYVGPLIRTYGENFSYFIIHSKLQNKVNAIYSDMNITAIFKQNLIKVILLLFILCTIFKLNFILDI